MTIFNFDHYKDYLKFWINSKPKKGRGVINAMSFFLKMKASLLSAILNTERNMTIEQALELNKFLNHSEIESEFFINLVSLDRAGTYQLKEFYRQQRKEIIKKSEIINKRINVEQVITDEQKSLYYSQVLYSYIRILSTLENGISLNELMNVTKHEKSNIQKKIEDLVAFGLIKKENDRYFSTNKNIHISKESLFYIQHRENWLLEQLRVVPDVGNANLNFTCPCTLNREDFEKIKKILLQSITETHAIINKSPAEQFACLTIDFISYDF